MRTCYQLGCPSWHAHLEKAIQYLFAEWWRKSAHRLVVGFRDLSQLNAAPFCFLDEVDAPLDDADVGRYADAVAKNVNISPFILYHP